MKNKTTQIIGRIRQLGLTALLTTGLATQAQTLVGVNGEHADVGLGYDAEANEWELHVHDEDNDVEYLPATDARSFIGNSAAATVPVGAQWSFLGTAGSEVWILPSSPSVDLLYLGFATEEMDADAFVGNQLSFALKGVSGPGTFALYDLDTFGDPIVLFNSADGITGADAFFLPVGTHQHFNLGFSAPGDYTITFEASGNSVLHGFTSSGNVDYLFRVQAVPEPTAGALAGVGALVFWLVRRTKRN
jgi:surface-anchored protein